MVLDFKMIAAALAVVALGWGTSAAAQNAVEIGGRSSVTANLSVTTTAPDDFDDSTTLLLGGLAAYTTEDARFEVGGGLTILGLFSSFDASAVSLSGQARINSDALGPEENVLLYLGAVVGVAFIEVDGFNDEIGIFGPKVGAEFYFTPDMAFQVEDVLVGDTEGGVTNSLTIGLKLLFE